MGLLDSVIGVLSGIRTSSGRGDMLNAVLGMLADDGDGPGIGELVRRFEQGGHAEEMSSWIGRGENLPIAPDALQDVLGGETIQRLAQQLGLSQDVPPIGCRRCCRTSSTSSRRAAKCRPAGSAHGQADGRGWRAAERRAPDCIRATNASSPPPGRSGTAGTRSARSTAARGGFLQPHRARQLHVGAQHPGRPAGRMLRVGALPVRGEARRRSRPASSRSSRASRARGAPPCRRPRCARRTAGSASACRAARPAAPAPAAPAHRRR